MSPRNRFGPHLLFLLYDFIFLTIGSLAIPFFLGKKFFCGNPRRGMSQRLGRYSSEFLDNLRDKEVIWLHAVSVGETKTAASLIKSLRAERPNSVLIISSVTETGHATALQIPEVDAAIFAPLDLAAIVKRALRQIRPACLIIVETEIWPNFVRLAHATGVPVYLVNGRISDRSFPRYRKVRFFLKPLLRCFSRLCMQTSLDAERILRLGAPKGKVEVTRNLKFDLKPPIPDPNRIVKMRVSLGFHGDALVWVAGSTHRGEEEILCDVYRKLHLEFPNLYLLLIPRHPERSREVAESLRQLGLSAFLLSEIRSSGRRLRPGEVLIGDTLGEMLDFYACSDLAFVGGTMVNVGGHNLLEPASLKKPVLFGPYVQNFKEISSLLLSCYGGVQVKNRGQLFESSRRLLVDAELRRQMGEAGYKLLIRNAGATDHTLACIRESLLQ